MNLYFVLEGEQTEIQLYPKWIEYFLPELQQVYFEKDVVANNYYIFSGGGIPSIYNHTINAIKNINNNPIFDRLIVCLDGEEIGVEDRIIEAKKKIEDSGVILVDNCKIEIIIQNICIETWFLGNRRVIKRNPSNSNLNSFLVNHNVINQDPELMDKIDGYRNKAHYHFSYLREVFKEHNLRYSKSRPTVVLERTYLDELVSRTNDTDHLKTLKNFFNLINELRANLNK